MGFMDYKTYDTSKGYGNSSEWRKAFNYRMDSNEAKEIIKEASPYEILKLSSDTTWNEVVKQFRKLAMEHHPDKGGSTKTMQKIIAAYTIIKEK